MKAVHIQEPEGFEGIEGLVYEDAPDPRPAIGDVRWPSPSVPRRAVTSAATVLARIGRPSRS